MTHLNEYRWITIGGNHVRLRVVAEESITLLTDYYGRFVGNNTYSKVYHTYKASFGIYDDRIIIILNKKTGLYFDDYLEQLKRSEMSINNYKQLKRDLDLNILV